MYVAVLCMYILQVCTSSAAFHSDMGRRPEKGIGEIDTLKTGMSPDSRRHIRAIPPKDCCPQEYDRHGKQ